MRLILSGMVLLGMVADATAATPAQLLDEVFAVWEKQLKTTDSLVVEFSVEIKDRIDQSKKRHAGVLKLLRTPKGELLGSYAVGDGTNAESLLSDGNVYLLLHEKKKAVRLARPDNIRTFLENHFNPFVVLPDRKRTEELLHLDVCRRDEHHIYVNVRPKAGVRSTGESERIAAGRIVLAADPDGVMIPRHMPRQLWYSTGIEDRLFEVRAWRMNGKDVVKPEEFITPERRKGWEVVEWPFGAGKQ